MKRVVILSLVFLFMLVHFSSAQSCASADDTILRLSSSTNAHGQKYDQTPVYPIGICFSNIFGQPAPTNPSRTCSGSGNGNRIVRLSSPINAHAEIPDATSPNYATEICYQGLTCQSIAGNVACPTGKKEVLRLSSATNAHLGTANETTYTTSNSYKICCSITGTTPTGQPATWKKLDGSQLTTPPPICLNQYVIAHTQTGGAVNGEVTSWELWEDDCLVGNPPCALDDCLSGSSSGCVNNTLITSTVQNGSSFLPPIQITSDAFSAGGESDIELYFKVTMASQPNSPIYSYVIEAVDSSQCSYPLPVANINAPAHQGIYFANTQIDFVQGCSNPVEPMNYQWTIIQSGQVLNLGQSATFANFQHTFANTGQAIIKLTCTGQISSLSATVETQILVVASPFMFTYIDIPGFNEVIYNQPPTQTTQPYFPTQTQFSAANSFAVDTNIQGSNCNVNCLAGNCPSQTQNSPAECIGTNGQSGGPLTVSGTPASHSNINFNWRFWDSNWNEHWTQFEGTGVHSGSVAYDDLSNAINDKHMSLTAGVSGASATFERDFTLGRCLNNGGNYLDSSGNLLSTTVSPVPGACKGFDPISPLDDCCPIGMVCRSSSGNEFCVVPQTPIDTCNDMNQQQCNNWTNVNLQAPTNQMPDPPICTYLECLWNSNANNGQGKCEVHDINYTISSQGCSVPVCVNSDCTWSTTQTNCQNGQKTIGYTGTPVPNPEIPLCAGQTNTCTRPSVTVPCGVHKFELGFFGYIQFIVTAIVIALIYISKVIRLRK